MKKLKSLKKLTGILDEYTKELISEIDKIKKEHQKLILLSNYNLLSEIAKGENLDESTLIEKYMKKQKKSKSSKVVSTEEIKDELLLSHMKFDGEDYYFEDKPNGSVYNDKSEKVGVFKCGNIKLDS